VSVVTVALRVLNKVGLLRHLTFNVPMAPSGKRTLVPMMKGVGFIYVLEFEPFMDTLIQRLVPLFPGAFVDVGVNIGQTLIKVRSAWPDLPYFGFEPNPVCVRYAERLIAANNYSYTRIVPAALTDRDGDGSLLLWHAENTDDPTATLVKDFRTKSPNEKEIPVQLASWAGVEKRLDIGKLGFVKIDVEGGELEVLLTMQDRIREDRPVIAVEVLPTYDPPKPARMERQQGIERMAATCDLKIFRLHKQGSAIRLEALHEFGVFSDLRTADHLLVPAERVAEVVAAFAA
jgi:FkbM family methyltransferase